MDDNLLDIEEGELKINEDKDKEMDDGMEMEISEKKRAFASKLGGHLKTSKKCPKLMEMKDHFK